MRESRFDISEKSSNEWLAKNQSNYGSFRIRVAEDIFKNVQELMPGKVDWQEVVRGFRSNLGSGASWFIGERVLKNTEALKLASLALRAGWHMHSPEIVYASGALFGRAIRGETVRLSERANQIETGGITFTAPERKGSALWETKQKLDRMLGYQTKLKEALRDYAGQSLPEDPRYLEILGTDLVSLIPIPVKRYLLFGYLRDGNIDEAYFVFLNNRSAKDSLAFTFPTG